MADSYDLPSFVTYFFPLLITHHSYVLIWSVRFLIATKKVFIKRQKTEVLQVCALYAQYSLIMVPLECVAWELWMKKKWSKEINTDQPTNQPTVHHREATLLMNMQAREITISHIANCKEEHGHHDVSSKIFWLDDLRQRQHLHLSKFHTFCFTHTHTSSSRKREGEERRGGERVCVWERMRESEREWERKR